MMLEDDGFDVMIANVGEDWVLGRPDAIERMAILTPGEQLTRESMRELRAVMAA